MIDCIQAITSDFLQNFVEEILDKITLYKVEVDSVTWQRNKGMQYSVEMVLEGEKIYADGQGEETATLMNDWIELGFYNLRDEEVLLKKVRLRQGKNHLTIQLPSKPSTLVIDPYSRIMLKEFNRE